MIPTSRRALPLRRGAAALLARVMPRELRDTDEGLALGMWLADVGEAILGLARAAMPKGG